MRGQKVDRTKPKFLSPSWRQLQPFSSGCPRAGKEHSGTLTAGLLRPHRQRCAAPQTQANAAPELRGLLPLFPFYPARIPYLYLNRSVHWSQQANGEWGCFRRCVCVCVCVYTYSLPWKQHLGVCQARQKRMRGIWDERKPCLLVLQSGQ